MGGHAETTRFKPGVGFWLGPGNGATIQTLTSETRRFDVMTSKV